MTSFVAFVNNFMFRLQNFSKTKPNSPLFRPLNLTQMELIAQCQPSKVVKKSTEQFQEQTGQKAWLKNSFIDHLPIPT